MRLFGCDRLLTWYQPACGSTNSQIVHRRISSSALLANCPEGTGWHTSSFNCLLSSMHKDRVLRFIRLLRPFQHLLHLAGPPYRPPARDTMAVSARSSGRFFTLEQIKDCSLPDNATSMLRNRMTLAPEYQTVPEIPRIALIG